MHGFLAFFSPFPGSDRRKRSLLGRGRVSGPQNWVLRPNFVKKLYYVMRRKSPILVFFGKVVGFKKTSNFPWGGYDLETVFGPISLKTLRFLMILGSFWVRFG